LTLDCQKKPATETSLKDLDDPELTAGLRSSFTPRLIQFFSATHARRHFRVTTIARKRQVYATLMQL
jgi:hypothetical protein